MKAWDYKIAKDWQPQTETEWLWYLERKINYDDWASLRKVDIKKYLPQLKKRLDPGRRAMLGLYFQNQ